MSDARSDATRTTTMSCGYICSLGDPQWPVEKLRTEIDPFIDAYRRQRKFFGGDNVSGNTLFHSFILWCVVRFLKPTTIVESGILKGQTSWLLLEAASAWRPKLVRFDPVDAARDKPYVPSSCAGCIDFTYRNFTDFARVDWDKVIAPAERSQALLVLDDHQDHLKRIEQAQSFGFRHALFDDNFMPGVGDLFSVKNACDGGHGGKSGGSGGGMGGGGGGGHQMHEHAGQGCGGGHMRAMFGPSVRCDNFHSSCEKLTEKMMSVARRDLLSAVDVIWEGPPLAPIIDPYAGIRTLIRGSSHARTPTQRFQYEGPTANLGRYTWNASHTRYISRSTKPPVIPTIEEAVQRLGMPIEYIDGHAGTYINMVYVRIRAKGGTSGTAKG